MSDLYLTIDEQPDSVLAAIASAMDDRINDPSMQAICREYMGRLPNPGRDVLEIGCGNGASTGMIVNILHPARVVGVDPSEGLLDRARKRFGTQPSLSFRSGDALATGQADAEFDIVVTHTVYSHLADPAGALREAFRVLKPGGTLAVFDGDYATSTVALFDGDPLQSTMEVAQRSMVHNPYVMRHMPRMMQEAGFEAPQTQAHGFVQTSSPDYILSLIARGTTAASSAGEFGQGLATAFHEEALRRVRNGSFYGAILFVSALARKPQG